MTHYEEFRHPNMMTEASQNIQLPTNTDRAQGFMPEADGEHNLYGCKSKTSLYYFKKFDDQFLRPIFVYKYEQSKSKPEVSFEAILRESAAFFDIGGFHY